MYVCMYVWMLYVPSMKYMMISYNYLSRHCVCMYVCMHGTGDRFAHAVALGRGSGYCFCQKDWATRCIAWSAGEIMFVLVFICSMCIYKDIHEYVCEYVCMYLKDNNMQKNAL